MNKSLTASVSPALVSYKGSSKIFTLTSSEHNIEVGNWKIDSTQLGILDTYFTLEQKVLHGGKQEGSKIIVITSPNGLTITLSPTRGMSIMNVTGKEMRFGWDSPVKEVVNPAFINLESRNGAGWLEGFNEMVVRCGFEWAGHPGVDNGEMRTLHGKAGNTPASEVEIEINEEAPYEIKVRGLIKESTFKKADLRTVAELIYIPDTHHFTIHDQLTNHADYPRNYQIMYHSNFSKPLLEKDAQFIAPIKEISPFNDYAKKSLKDYSTYLGPTKDFDEMVFNIVPYTKADRSTIVALHNKDGSKGVAIKFNINELPFLTLWKNTDTEKQGYVTGIEPGTNYAYATQIEREQNRIQQINAGQTVHFTVKYLALMNKQDVNTIKEVIADIQGKQETTFIETPIAKE